MSRRIAICVAAAAAVVLALAGCGGGGAVHAQSYSPSTPQTSSSSHDAPTTPAPTSRPKTSKPAKPSHSAVPTPTVTPPAQAAVNAYVAFYNLGIQAQRDPAHADLAALNRYLTGKAVADVDGSFQSMKKQGIAYRGTPPNPRLKVVVAAATRVDLHSCLLDSPTDPWVGYYVASGKPVPVQTRTPPPPYPLLITMRLVNGKWKNSQVIQDASRTCTG